MLLSKSLARRQSCSVSWLRHKKFYSYETAKNFKMIYFDTRKGKPLRCVWTHLRGQLLLCKNVILKQNCLRSTLFNRRIFCLEKCKSGKPNPIKGSPKKGDSPHGVGNVAKRQKRLPCKGSWLWAMRTDWGIKKPKYFLFKIYFLRKSLRVALTRPTSILREARRREKWTVKKQNQKPTAFEIAYLVIEAIIAISTLITAIKWW